MKKELSVKNRILISYGVNGLLWLTSSILDLVDFFHHSPVIECVNIGILLVAIITTLKVMLNRNQEEEDEMSEQEFGNSCVSALFIIFLLFMLFDAVISGIEIAGAGTFLQHRITLKKVADLMRAGIFGTIGLTELLIGIFFCRQERE